MFQRHANIWLIPLGLLLGACASGWPTAAEITHEGTRAEALGRAKAVLRDPEAALGDRQRAAHLIGELGEPCAGCVGILGGVLMSADAPESLRAHAAWSLGRLEDASGTEILARSLAIIEGELAPAYVFDALWAKQEQIFADAELQADLAEGLNAHSARRAGVLSPSARALQNRVATLPVSVRVLDRAIGSWLDRPDPHRAAALSRAIDTVLRRFDEAFEERKRRPDDAWVEVREAVFFLQRAALVGGPSARRQVWSEIGARSREAIIARAVAEAFYGAEAPVPGRPTHAPLASDRFVGAWLAERVLLTRPSVRAALETDILLWESSPEVFMLLAALGRAREIDLVRELAP